MAQHEHTSTGEPLIRLVDSREDKIAEIQGKMPGARRVENRDSIQLVVPVEQHDPERWKPVIYNRPIKTWQKSDIEKGWPANAPLEPRPADDPHYDIPSLAREVEEPWSGSSSEDTPLSHESAHDPVSVEHQIGTVAAGSRGEVQQLQRPESGAAAS